MALTIDSGQFGVDHTHEQVEGVCIEYFDIPTTSQLYERAVRHYQALKSGHLEDNSRYMCLGKTVVFQIMDPKGNLIAITDNRVTQPIAVCNKHVEDENHYTSCAEICGQVCHSEIRGILEYFLSTGQISQGDVDSISHEPVRLRRRHPNGSVLFGTRISHASLKNLILTRELKVAEGTFGYMYGHKVCCKQCAEILYMIGLRRIGVTEQTLTDQRKEREDHHNTDFARMHIESDDPYFVPGSVPNIYAEA